MASLFLFLDPEEWEWQELRDYVVDQIQKNGGSVDTTAVKERAVFKSFMGRYPNAIQIALSAFETFGGVWKGSPVKIESFCKGSDPYFGDEIARVLERSEVK